MPYLPGAPTVLTCYDVIPLVFPNYFSALQRILYRSTNRLALRAARRVLVISEATRRDLQKYFGVAPAKMVVTPLAADPAFAPASAEQVAAVRAKFSLPAEYVLYLGSNKPHKNLATLLRAVEKITTPLVVAGAYDVRYPIAPHNGKTILLRDVSEADLPALYSGATVFVFPSLYEGFGLPPLEAMACGAPVICSNTSSLPEVVGDAALLVNPHAANEIADAIERVLTNPALRDELRAKGLAHAQKFSWERTARETLAIYKRVCAQ
jgi:alpha-1,3-rhamnosyl/mannosyltransferase